MNAHERACSIRAMLTIKTSNGTYKRKIQGRVAILDHGCELRFFINGRRIDDNSVINFEPIKHEEK